MRALQSPRSRSKAFRGAGESPAKAQDERGRMPYNIWYVFSPKTKRDYILESDTALDHFFLLEADPTVESYEIHPETMTAMAGQEVRRTQFDVLVKLRSGRPQLRDLRTDAHEEVSPSHRESERRATREAIASQAGFDYLVVDEPSLKAHYLLICNWRRAVAFLAAAREISLDSYRNEIMAAVARNGAAEIGRLLEGTAKADEPLYLAAIFERLQHSALVSDLHLKPLSMLTRISFPGGA